MLGLLGYKIESKVPKVRARQLRTTPQAAPLRAEEPIIQPPRPDETRSTNLSNLFNAIRPWNPGDTREVPERMLEQARSEGKYDSYAQVYVLDSCRWKIQGQSGPASGETIFTLVCVKE